MALVVAAEDCMGLAAASDSIGENCYIAMLFDQGVEMGSNQSAENLLIAPVSVNIVEIVSTVLAAIRALRVLHNQLMRARRQEAYARGVGGQSWSDAD